MISLILETCFLSGRRREVRFVYFSVGGTDGVWYWLYLFTGFRVVSLSLVFFLLFHVVAVLLGSPLMIVCVVVGG